MSVLVRRVVRDGTRRLVRSSRCFSSSNFTPPCFIVGLAPALSCAQDAMMGNLRMSNGYEIGPRKVLQKKVPLFEFFDDDYPEIGASNGWVARVHPEDGRLRLLDDLNPFASEADPKRILLPPLVTKHRCQTKIITNVAMSSSSPEDEECVVGVKFLGPQLSFCRPAESNPKWTNIHIQEPCLYSSRLMFSKTDEAFHLLGSGCGLIKSWDLNHILKKVQPLRFENLEKREDSDHTDLFNTSEYLVDSQSTGEMFIVKTYKETCSEAYKDNNSSVNSEYFDYVNMETKQVLVFKLDIEQGKAVYTQDIGDLAIFISHSESLCFTASSFPGISPNQVYIWDCNEHLIVTDLSHIQRSVETEAAYLIPPQNIEQNSQLLDKLKSRDELFADLHLKVKDLDNKLKESQENSLVLVKDIENKLKESQGNSLVLQHKVKVKPFMEIPEWNELVEEYKKLQELRGKITEELEKLAVSEEKPSFKNLDEAKEKFKEQRVKIDILVDNIRK